MLLKLESFPQYISIWWPDKADIVDCDYEVKYVKVIVMKIAYSVFIGNSQSEDSVKKLADRLIKICHSLSSSEK